MVHIISWGWAYVKILDWVILGNERKCNNRSSVEKIEPSPVTSLILETNQNPSLTATSNYNWYRQYGERAETPVLQCRCRTQYLQIESKQPKKFDILVKNELHQFFYKNGQHTYIFCEWRGWGYVKIEFTLRKILRVLNANQGPHSPRRVPTPGFSRSFFLNFQVFPSWIL